jgi:RND family efflux transporter MFP subunit
MIQAGTASNTQAMPLVRISEISRLRLILPVPESVVPKIHVGALVEVKVQSLEKTFQGTITRFANKIDVSTRTMETEVDVPNPNFILTPGMYASALITLDQKNDVIAVPSQVITSTEGKTTLFVVNQEKAIEERPVTLGMETETKVEVLSGLTEGDMVVIGNRSQYKPGQKVETKLIETEISGGQ